MFDIPSIYLPTKYSFYVWLIPLLILLMLVATQFGAVSVGTSDWMGLLNGRDDISSTGGYVLWHLRLPRILFALLIGSALGLAGALTQGLFRNPLAEPGLLGVSAGATCMVAMGIVFLGDLNISLPTYLRIWFMPLLAFTGSLIICFTLNAVARLITPGSIAGLLLTGIGLNALAVSVVGLCTYLANDEQLRNLTFWTMGSLSGSNWMLVTVIALMMLIAGLRLQHLSGLLNVFSLGETVVGHIGVSISHIRIEIIVWVALLAGFAVAWCGMIGFIGLIAPNIARLLLGGNQRRVLPASIFIGGILLLVADTLARSIAIPAEVPVGIFTALLGAPFFILILRSSHQQAS